MTEGDTGDMACFLESEGSTRKSRETLVHVKGLSIMNCLGKSLNISHGN